MSSSVRYRKQRPSPTLPQRKQPDLWPADERRVEEIIENEEEFDDGSDKVTAFEIVRLIFTVLVINFLLSYFITDSYFWNYDSLILRPRYLQFLLYRALDASGALPHLLPFLPSSSQLHTFSYPRNFTDSELALYNGKTPGLPIYLAINSSVFDVSEGRTSYGPGGPYHIFAGRDATRAFVTGCFTSDLTHDLRGIDEEKIKTDVAHWVGFFEKSNKYWYVGHVEHEPITGPPPGPCQSRAMRQKPGVRRGDGVIQ
ncbi:hypothetical protein BZA70DRAFT_273736 [Myxozyma melibiosi]|uniref:Cytochrome b5 heme-binding domain-containing protein n=1 Tax=Myxozyma melibiosi TaxID=54550 RepID=A0ABR1FF35_9ASCO